MNVEVMNRLLSTIEIAAINAKGRHWLVAGPGFDSAHTLLDKVWSTLLNGADKVAETVRTLSEVAEMNLKKLAERKTQGTIVTHEGH